MKRLSRKAKERLLRLQHYNEQELREAYVLRRRKRGERKAWRAGPAPAPRLYAPSVFSIENERDRSTLAAFLRQLRVACKTATKGTIVIDFSRTHRFIAHGTLLFYAEFARLIDFVGSRVNFRCTLAANARATEVLEQIGVLKLCRHEAKITPTFADVVHWRVARGHIVDNYLCAPTLEAFEGEMAEPLLDGIFRGLGEAMTNTKHHAYIATRNDDLGYKPPREDWWMFSQFRDGHLSVVFCDLGVGIPATLSIRKPELYATLQALGLAQTDSACIEKAIEDSRTRTRMRGRGWGLGNIVTAVSSARGGTVTVMSNKGCFIARDGKITRHDFRDSILGTLIAWRVPLSRP